VPPEMKIATDALEGALGRVQRRMLVRQALDGAAAIAGTCAIAMAAVRAAGGNRSIAVAVVGAAVCLTAAFLCGRWQARSRRAAAQAMERATPASRNLIITARELLDHPERGADWMRARVFADATGLVASVPAGHAVPLTRRALVAGLLVGGAVIAAAWPSRALDRTAPTETAAEASRAGTIDVRAQLTPPSYLDQPSQAIDLAASHDQIVAVSGSRLTLAVSGDEDLRIRSGRDALPMHVSQGRATVVAELTRSGYFAIESSDRMPPRLIQVTVMPDAPPAVTVEKPGRDLLLPQVREGVDVVASASDDFGLGSLSLRYTRVSGSGEQFEFVEGELPIDVIRESPTGWRARGRIDLTRLALEPGDAIVYRLMARDRQPGARAVSSSETYFIEIAGPGHVPLEGIEMPPDQDRYAFSQQMIVIKIERLRARESSLGVDSRREQTAAIAAEQRSVRANFVFLMGGHVEDEEEEAEHSNEIQEGRLENNARREIARAINAMSGAEQALVAEQTAPALAQARRAAEALQRAFGKSRYILRALPSQSRIDPSRRLSGSLDGAAAAGRQPYTTEVEREIRIARELLTEFVDLGRAIHGPTSSALERALTRAAETALSTSDDERWRQLSQRILHVRSLVSAGAASTERDEDIRAITSALAAICRDAGVAAGDGARPHDRLRSAWTRDERRR
jgi:hypothetical protein